MAAQLKEHARVYQAQVFSVLPCTTALSTAQPGVHHSLPSAFPPRPKGNHRFRTSQGDQGLSQRPHHPQQPSPRHDGGHQRSHPSAAAPATGSM
eukprot:353182-Chlamydomonas_euryale.AAC.53